MKKLKKVAMIYDFDNTLISGDMQNGSLVQSLGVGITEYWNRANKLMEEKDVDQILAFLYTTIQFAKDKKKKLTREFLNEHGRKIDVFYPGVIDWFDRINAYGRELGLEIEHYVVSSGYREMIEACAIADKFKKIFASHYMYDDNGEAVWPAYVVNYTQKTQYIARIEKGLVDVLYDSNAVNSKIKKSKAYIPYSRMIYIGDGETDVPCMRMIRSQGGYGVCVYDKCSHNSVDVAKKIVKDDRVDVSVCADYSAGGKLEAEIIKLLKKMK